MEDVKEFRFPNESRVMAEPWFSDKDVNKETQYMRWGLSLIAVLYNGAV